MYDIQRKRLLYHIKIAAHDLIDLREFNRHVERRLEFNSEFKRD